jgi:NADH-quinone oxidoreductase subunit D
MESGVTGPSLRACGVKADVRVDAPYAAYDRVQVDIPTSSGGDALARAVQVRLDFAESIRILRRLIAAIPDGPVNLDLGNLAKLRVPAGDAYSKVESSKGEFGYYVIPTAAKSPIA